MDRVAGVPRARRRHQDGHVPRGVRHARGVLPEGGSGAGGGRARHSGPPRLSADPLEVTARQQRPGAEQPRDKEQAARRADVPLHGFTGAHDRRGHVRAGRDVVGVKVLLGGKDGRALRRGPHARNRRDGRLGAAGCGSQEDNRIGPRACGQNRDGTGYQPCSRLQNAGPTRFKSSATPTFSTLPISTVWPTEKPKNRGGGA